MKIAKIIVASAAAMGIMAFCASCGSTSYQPAPPTQQLSTGAGGAAASGGGGGYYAPVK